MKNLVMTAALVCVALLCSCSSFPKHGMEMKTTLTSSSTDYEIILLQRELIILKKKFERKEESVERICAGSMESAEKFKAEITAYTACKEECGSNPTITATGTKVKPYRTAAVSRDLKHLLGKEIVVEGRSEVWIVEDMMHPKCRGSIDLLFDKKSSALEWGRRKNKVVSVL